MKNNLKVKVTSDEIYKRQVRIKFLKIAIVFILLFLSILYLALYVINSGGFFTISLDPNLKAERSIQLSPHSDFRDSYLNIKVKGLEYMDNITESWLPDDIATAYEGDHSSDNYIAYTFFIKNEGDSNVNYYRELQIDSVIKDVDEAVRVALYVNGEKTTYAKLSKAGVPEKGTTSFLSSWQVFKDDRNDFKPNEVDKYTIVIWLEGEDPECIDDIIGGEMKMTLLIKEIMNS